MNITQEPEQLRLVNVLECHSELTPGVNVGSVTLAVNTHMSGTLFMKRLDCADIQQRLHIPPLMEQICALPQNLGLTPRPRRAGPASQIQGPVRDQSASFQDKHMLHTSSTAAVLFKRQVEPGTVCCCSGSAHQCVFGTSAELSERSCMCSYMCSYIVLFLDH